MKLAEKSLGTLLMFAAAVFLPACAPERSQAAGTDGAGQPKLEGPDSFIDRFANRNPKRWSVSHDWSNGSWMVNDWHKSQVSFNDGLRLQLGGGKGGKRPFSSGEVQSRSTFGHGYFETAMRAAPGSGIVTGFFTYTGAPFGKPWNEIDVEILGARPTKLFATYFYKGEKVSEVVDLGFDATRGVHHYSFDWQPGWIRWYVDGRMVHETRGRKLPLPNEKQKLMMHLWGSETQTDWVGPFDARSLPTTANFACVAYDPVKPGRDGCR